MATLMTSMILMTSSLTGFAASYEVVYEDKSPLVHYAQGVTQQTMRTFTNNGWINAEVVRVDLSQNVKMDVITNEYLSSRDVLSKIVAKNNPEKDIVVAMNADFFDVKNNTTMGHVVKNGEILTTAINLENFATFNISGKGVPYVAYTNNTVNTFSNGTHTLKIDYFNKPYLRFNLVVCFDSNWAAKSMGKTLGAPIVEMLVVDNVITEIRKDGDPFIIPENGYVIAAVGTSINTVEQQYKVGDKAEIKLDVNLDLLSLGISGGTQIVKNGAVMPKFTQSSNGYAPRTAIGITKDRMQLIMVTVDGNTSPYKGMTFTEMAQFMMKLGAFEAMCFDGGGSTQIMGKAPWADSIETLNTPSDGTERRMYTGLVVRKERVENPTLEAIQVAASQSLYYINTEMPLTIKALDSNYDSVTVNEDEVIWSVSGIKGRFNGSTFIPTQAGKGTIQAVYKGKRAECAIQVTSEATKLIVSPSHISLSQESEQTMSFSVLAESGETFSIPTSAVKFLPEKAIGGYDPKTGIYKTGKTTGQGYVGFEVDGLKTYVPVSVGTSKLKLYDFEKETATGRAYPTTAMGHYFETPLISRSGNGGQLVYDFTTTDETRAMYMDFKAVSVLPSNATGLGMWVYGDEGNGHWLRAHLTDSEGKTHFITLAREVNWKGWKYVSADLPTEIKGPVTFNRAYLVESDANKKSAGYIVIDDIEAHLAQEVLVTLPKNVQRMQAISDYKLPTGYTEKTAGVFNVSYAKSWTDDLMTMRAKPKASWVSTSDGFSATFKSGTWLLTLDNRKGSIVKNGTTQWKGLLNFFGKNPKAPVILVMNDTFSFSDPLEKELLYTKLSALQGDITVVHPTTLKEPSMRFYKGIRVLQVPYATDKAIPFVSVMAYKGKLQFELDQIE